MSWDRVNAWIEALRAVDPAPLTQDGAAGARQAWTDALDALSPAALAAAAAVPGTPYPRTTFVAARTVFSAPIEWCALLLGHGGRVRLKYPRSAPGSALVLAETAIQVGLPLAATPDRAAVHGADLVIAMGSDETTTALRKALPDSTDTLLFGHRFSAAWIDQTDGFDAAAQALWPFDSRGCMSPQVVFTPLPLAVAVPALAASMAAAEAAFPRGIIGAGEGARIRARGALAQITGARASGDSWAVHGLQARHWYPESLPRCIAVVQVADRAAAQAVIAPWSRWLSSVGDGAGLPWFDARVCPVHALQRPTLDRLHDGVDVLRAVIRPAT